MPDIYLHLKGQQAGPYSVDAVRTMIAGGISGQTLAWHAGLSEWTTADALLATFPPAPPSRSLPPLPPPFVPQTTKNNGCMWAGIAVGGFFFVIFVVSILAGIALGPITSGIKKARQTAAMQQSRQIGLAMFAYAEDHGGKYPDGKTSTEVFQKLIDEGFVSDPAVFYFSMPGKIRGTSKKLSAENVCYDVTAGVTEASSAKVPVVYSEGYTLVFKAGAPATPDAPGPPPFDGIAVFYKDGMAKFITARRMESAPDVVPPDFTPGSETYQQLRP